MKRLILLLFVFSMGIICYAQTDSLKVINNTNDSLTEISNEWLEQIELDLSLKQRYKLYPTENIYTFLLLDTKTGMIDKVQWNLDTRKEFSVSINSDDLTYGYGHGSGSFELYPTQNMYQFILLDKTSGRTWHVQWGMEASERWIRRIY
jgi:hypothetical protein